MPATRANHATDAEFGRLFPANHPSFACTKHTPGPWRVERRAILFDDPVMGTTCLAEVFSGAADSLAQANANDHLIAAAPDLLAACQCMLELIERRAKDIAGHLECDDARAAIAKAAGRI